MSSDIPRKSSPAGLQRVIDWEKVEKEYRAGQLSIREIGALHKVSHVAIMKRAKRDKWDRNLAAAVREKVTAKLVTEGVTAKSAAETIELAAARDVHIIREHRRDIREGRMMAKALMEELRETTDNRDEIEEEIEAETAEDKNTKRRAMMLRAVSLSSRVSTLFTLSSTHKNYMGLERQAFGLDDPQDKRLDAADGPRDLSNLSEEDLDAIERIVVKVANGGGDTGGEGEKD